MKRLFVLVFVACGSPQQVVTPDPVPTTTSAPAPSATVASPPNADPSFTLPFHDATVLRVYGAPKKSESGYSDVALDADITLERFDPRTNTTTPLGHIHPRVGGNAGGIFVPFAITRDDKHILLDAHMGPPGAGGAMVDYGYGVMTVGSETVDTLATRAALFFDEYEKVVFVTEGDNTPHYTMPGPSNDAVVVLRYVASSTSTPLLAARDTSYALVSADARQHTLKYRATHYTFSPACPRAENAESCAKTTVTEGTLHIP